jgi:hypothetical protein
MEGTAAAVDVRYVTSEQDTTRSVEMKKPTLRVGCFILGKERKLIQIGAIPCIYELNTE